MCANEFVDVKVNIGGNIHTIKMERGTSFENNGGIYSVGDDGSLTVFDKNNNKQSAAKEIKMTNYQMKIFDAIANNDGQAGLSKQDIKKAMDLYSQGKFIEDMSEFLPTGYKIESAKKSTAEQYVQVNVANQQDKTSKAALKFGITNSKTADNTAKTAATNKNAPAPKAQNKRAVTQDDKNVMGADKDGSFNAYEFLAMRVNQEIADYGGYEKLLKQLEKYDGKPITPELINTVITTSMNEILKENNNNDNDNDNDNDNPDVNTKGGLGAMAIRLADHLPKETLDKLLDNDFIGTAQGKDFPTNKNDLKNLKTVYDRLTPKQKTKYYDQVLNKNNAQTRSLSDAGGEYITSDFAKYIFENPVSGQTYTKLKAFITDINKRNGISGTLNASKEAIEVLQSKGQITAAQAKELRQAAGLK